MSDSRSLPLTDASLMKSRAYIDGAWVDADSAKDFPVTDPADGAVIARVPDMRASETRRAILAADAALPAWRNRTAAERAGILRRWHDAIMQNQRDLALLMTSEQGKPLAEAISEIAYGAAFVEWFSEEARRVYGDIIPTYAPDRRIVVLKQGIGVVAAITPWNFPVAMITRKVAPALAAGCTAVVKPASETPLCALALAELAERVGMPKGVLNVVTTASASAVGTEMMANPLVRKLSFTGSTEVGKTLMVQAAATVKRLSLELGGNAPFIVFDDADPDAALAGLMASKFRNAGQTCVCANRILVQDGIHDAFAERLVRAVGTLKVGPGRDKGVTLGPLIGERAVVKIERFIADALDKGAKLAAGGQRHALGAPFFEPTVLTEVGPDMRVSREEVFGPVAPLIRFRTEAEAIRLANDTPYGLAAYLYSRDIGRCWRVAEALEYGMVGVNEGLISTEIAPFGGVKESGIGREGSKYGIDEFIELKYLCLGGIALPRHKS